MRALRPSRSPRITPDVEMPDASPSGTLPAVAAGIVGAVATTKVDNAASDKKADNVSSTSYISFPLSNYWLVVPPML